mgnify:CR=1 FL=1
MPGVEPEKSEEEMYLVIDEVPSEGSQSDELEDQNQEESEEEQDMEDGNEDEIQHTTPPIYNQHSVIQEGAMQLNGHETEMNWDVQSAMDPASGEFLYYVDWVAGGEMFYSPITEDLDQHNIWYWGDEVQEDKN